MQVIQGGKFNIKVEFFQEGDVVIAYSHALDLTTQGATVKEAAKNFHEAAELWIETCREMGTLDKALRELGWKPVTIRRRTTLAPPEPITEKQQAICIPA